MTSKEIFDLSYEMCTSLITQSDRDRLKVSLDSINECVAEYDEGIAGMMGEGFKLGNDTQFRILLKGLSTDARVDLNNIDNSFKNHFQT